MTGPYLGHLFLGYSTQFLQSGPSWTSGPEFRMIWEQRVGKLHVDTAVMTGNAPTSCVP